LEKADDSIESQTEEACEASTITVYQSEVQEYEGRLQGTGQGKNQGRGSSDTTIQSDAQKGGERESEEVDEISKDCETNNNGEPYQVCGHIC
jgi:hypothetical protein